MIPAAYDPQADIDLDLFAGPGGWDQGVAPLGVRPVGVEWDALACLTARAAGHLRHQGDISCLDPLSFVRGYTLARVRGLIASPPCQGFSPAGKGTGRADAALILSALHRLAAGKYGRLSTPRGAGAAADRMIADLHQHMTDDRSVLALEPLRWVLYLRPEWTAWEQVVPVRALWESCAEVLRAVGYDVEVGVLHAEEYGVPQTRSRAILVAHRDRPVSLPTPTHTRYMARQADGGRYAYPLRQPWVTMADALGHVPEAAVPGDTSWTERRPSPTIVGSFRPDIVASPGWRKAGDGPRQNQPGSVRVTVQEAAVLQSFPPDYPFQGGKSDQYRQVGDAVPPALAHAIVAALL